MEADMTAIPTPLRPSLRTVGRPENAVPATPWCLRFLSGALRGRSIALRPGTNVIGSGGDCEVMLPGGEVQPRHLAFTVGELAVSVQRLGDAGAQLNGEDLPAQRRSVVPGDVITVGQIDFQLDRSQPAPAASEEAADSMFLDPEAALPAEEAEAGARRAGGMGRARWVGLGVLGLALAGTVALASWRGGTAGAGSAQGPALEDVKKVLASYPEVQVVADGNGLLTLRGFVESRARKAALREALQPLGARVQLSVLGADEMVEQARRFISDPGVAVRYAGQGRLVVSGTSEDDDLRQQIHRLAEDLHPAVLVSDQVQYRAKPVREGDDERARAQWSAWRDVLPARMVGITEDADGMRHIQLANGSRYYEGSVLRSGAELQRIDADGLVIHGGVPPGKDKR
jgi:type III secretion protein D